MGGEADITAASRRFGVKVGSRFRRHRYAERCEDRQYKYGNAERSVHSI